MELHFVLKFLGNIYVNTLFTCLRETSLATPRDKSRYSGVAELALRLRETSIATPAIQRESVKSKERISFTFHGRRRPLHSLLIYTYATKHSFAEKSAILTSSSSNNTLSGSLSIWYSGMFLAWGKMASIGAFCVSALSVKR